MEDFKIKTKENERIYQEYIDIDISKKEEINQYINNWVNKDGWH
jgi:hypothetical protein